MASPENGFTVPVGHVLHQVGATLHRRTNGGVWERREHEEYDHDGRLVAVYESWVPAAAGPLPKPTGSSSSFVKYSPFGWVLGCSRNLVVGTAVAEIVKRRDVASAGSGSVLTLPG